MRTSRGLQITSIVVLSPVLLILISLISILFLSIYSHIQSILSTQTLQRDSADMIILQQQRSFNHTKSKRFRFFSKSRQSPMTWCIIIICYLVYILIKKRRDEKKQKETETRQTEPIPIKTKKHSKRRKVLKKTTQKSVKKRERTNSFSSPFIEPKPVNIHQPPPQQQQPLIDDKEEWTSVKKKIVNTHSLPSPTSCTTPEFDNNLIDLLPSPEITPIHSEDEQQQQQQQQTVENHNNWYSPFVTGLDLDIIPKLPQDPLLSIFTINHFKTTIPSIHSPPSRIKLLESHPFIPSSSSSSHTHPPPTYGFIGDKRKKV
ncbi:hypothetical protein BD770DRAFT_127862 [Pilaira anomala]|nr:hypothetical protein BD770DRAFT_127862 [Pilaira anomala]